MRNPMPSHKVECKPRYPTLTSIAGRSNSGTDRHAPIDILITTICEAFSGVIRWIGVLCQCFGPPWRFRLAQVHRARITVTNCRLFGTLVAPFATIAD